MEKGVLHSTLITLGFVVVIWIVTIIMLFICFFEELFVDD